MTSSEGRVYSPVAALVMAGAPNDGPLKEADDAPYEALIRIGGRPMIEYVLDVLRAAPSVGAVGVVGPAGLRGHVRQDELLIEPGGAMLDNLERGARALQAAGHTGHLLVVTSDIPLVTVEALELFLQRCRERRASAPPDAPEPDAYYPMVRRETSEARFPGVRRTYVGLRDGQFTGGNFVLLNPDMVLERRYLFDRVVALRKDPLGMARILGLGFIVNFLLRRLSAGDIERIVREKLGIHGAVIEVPHAEVGFDVDKPGDLAIAAAELGGR
ncbi:MAG: nucleotidyltransferase family protein [Limnochordales bacterium]